ncbi:MAG: HAD family hydrolase [Armatimonadota bacterium]|nr:MAG: HAD family hydrolase [Armatimonadota bacterium]
MRYRAVIFDLFGTLIENFSRAEYRRVLVEMADIVGARADDFVRLWRETVEARMTGAFASMEASVEHICKALGLGADASQTGAAAEVRLDFTRRALRPREGALETLTELRKRDCKIGLISDCTLEVPALWDESPFAPLVDEAVFSCIARVRKPDPRIYGMACARLGVRPEECVYVGDGSSGELTGAARVGMHPVLLRVPYEDPKEWERAEAEEWEGAKVSALRETLSLVE